MAGKGYTDAAQEVMIGDDGNDAQSFSLARSSLIYLFGKQPRCTKTVNPKPSQIFDGNDGVLAGVTIINDDTATGSCDLSNNPTFVTSARFIKMTTASRFIKIKWLFI